MNENNTYQEQHVSRRPLPTTLLLSTLSLLLGATPACATPIDGGVVRRNADDVGGNGNGNGGTNPKIWVPIVVASVVLFILVILTKTNFRRSLSHVSLANFALTGAAPTAGLANTTAARRELTAEQLAGTINGEAGAGNGGTGGRGTAAPTTRRARRPRRTPSQMSVTSLPAYNKEPGEEELVVFRGQDMEDATMPPASVVRQSNDSSLSLSLDAHDQSHLMDLDNSQISLDRSQVSRYSPMPTSHNHVPLLNPDDTHEGDLSMQSLPSPIGVGDDSHDDNEGGTRQGGLENRRQSQRLRARRSSDAHSHETSSLMRVETRESADHNENEPEVDERGEAPPYFEVVEYDAQVSPLPEPTTSQAASGQNPQTPAQPQPPTQGRRGFRSLFNRMSIHSSQSSSANATASNTHNRNQSSTSAFSGGRDTPSRTSNLGHRSQHSASSSTFMFRTLSRQRSIHTLSSPSNANLTSPSMISLNSISSPLSHTLTRTEFTYPSKGLTAEQLRVISSREGMGRFGVPWGEEAVKFASASRVNLMEPPPGFEEVVGAGGSGASGSGTGAEVPPLPTAATTTTTTTTTTSPIASPSPPTQSPQTTQPSSPTPASPTTTTTNPPTTAVTPASRTNSIAKSLYPHDTPSSSRPTSTSTPTPISTSSRPASTVLPASEFGLLSAHDRAHDRELTQTSVRSAMSYATAAETLSRRRASTASAVGAFNDDDEDEVFEDAEDAPSTPQVQHGVMSSEATVVGVPAIVGAPAGVVKTTTTS